MIVAPLITTKVEKKLERQKTTKKNNLLASLHEGRSSTIFCTAPPIRQTMEFFLSTPLFRYCSLCWDHFKVVQTPHTCQALPCGSRAGAYQHFSLNQQAFLELFDMFISSIILIFDMNIIIDHYSLQLPYIFNIFISIYTLSEFWTAAATHTDSELGLDCTEAPHSPQWPAQLPAGGSHAHCLHCADIRFQRVHWAIYQVDR